MRTRLLALIVLMLAPILLGGALTSAHAEPGVRSTPEYQRLKSYVQQLEKRQDQPANQARKATFRRTLDVRRAKAVGKVRAQYAQRMAAAKQKRQDQRQRVRTLRQNRASEVAGLVRDRQARITAIDKEQRTAVAKVNERFAQQLKGLQRDRAKLQRKLDRATKPSVRKRLRTELDAVNQRIDSVARDKQAELNLINTRAANARETAKESYAARIARTKAEYARDIDQTQTALREVFAAKRAAAKSRRADDLQLVRALAARGTAAINSMPAPGN